MVFFLKEMKGIEMSDTIYAWHISNGYLAFGDGRKIEPGMALACRKDTIRMCRRGFHASETLIGILGFLQRYAVLSICECGGTMLFGYDKLVCSQRRHLAVANVDPVFHGFALWCVEKAKSLIRIERSGMANSFIDRILTTKMLWTKNNISDCELNLLFSPLLDETYFHLDKGTINKDEHLVVKIALATLTPYSMLAALYAYENLMAAFVRVPHKKAVTQLQFSKEVEAELLKRTFALPEFKQYSGLLK